MSLQEWKQQLSKIIFENSLFSYEVRHALTIGIGKPSPSYVFSRNENIPAERLVHKYSWHYSLY